MADAPAIEPIGAAHKPGILALNAGHVTETAPLDASELEALLRDAFYARAIGSVDAFLIALDQDAAYDSPNFQWFRERYTRFAYIDRVIVGAHAQRRGLAKALYEDLFAAALAQGLPLVGCEINQSPPNPKSDAFHAALGFEQVGEATLIGTGKVVRYLAKALSEARR